MLELPPSRTRQLALETRIQTGMLSQASVEMIVAWPVFVTPNVEISGAEGVRWID